MKSKFLIAIIITISTLMISCSNGNGDFDATGTFESEEIIISAEA